MFRRRALPLAAALTLAGCAHAGGLRPVFEVPQQTLVIAHRGGALEAPENTVAAVRNAVRSGADWIEIDVRLTRDGVPVVLHDDTVDRTTDGTGRVDELTSEEARRLRLETPTLDPDRAARLAAAGITPPDYARWADEHLPTLDEVLAVRGAQLMIELKPCAAGRALAAAVVKRLRGADASGRVALASFDPALLDAVRELDAALPLIGIAGDEATLEAHLQRPMAAVAVRSDLVAYALTVVRRGVGVWAWTIELARDALALADHGADGIITDAPSAVLQALRVRDGVAALP